MLDKTKPIILTRGFVDSRGNYYPPKETPYKPGEISQDAWKFKYAEIVEEVETSEKESENNKTSVLPETVEITNPSDAKVIKHYTDTLAPTEKVIKPKTTKQSN